MIFRDISLQTSEENLFFDDVLLISAEKYTKEEYLRVWESSETFVVLGRVSKNEEDLDGKRIQEDGVPVLRRSSGGGTVLQGKGCLNYSVVLSKEKNPLVKDLKNSYCYILEKIAGVFKNLGIECNVLPVSDIALLQNRKKISGNAQRRGKNFILHHGTVLYNFQISLMEKYLKMPKDVPDYRGERSHLEFVANVPIDPEAFKRILREKFKAGKEQNFITDQEKDILFSLLSKKNLPKLSNTL